MQELSQLWNAFNQSPVKLLRFVKQKKSEAFKWWPFFFLITERYFALFQLFPPKFSINFIIFLPFVFFRVSAEAFCLVSIPWEFHIFLFQMFGIIVRIRKGNSARSLILEHVHEIDDQRISQIHFLVMFFLKRWKTNDRQFSWSAGKNYFYIRAVSGDGGMRTRDLLILVYSLTSEQSCESLV